MSHWFTLAGACRVSVFASLSSEQRPFEVLSESANHQQSQRSKGSFDLDPPGVDQSWGCDEHAALTRLESQVITYAGWN